MRDVLVFQLARFGDVIQSKRLILTLAAQTDTRVHLCVDASLAALAGLLYPFAHIHTLPAHNTAPNRPFTESNAPAAPSPSAAVFQACRKTFAELRDADFAEVYLLNYSPLSFACASLFPPEILRGYCRRNGQDMRGQWTSLALVLMRDRRFSPLNLVDLWAYFHPAPCPPETVNPIPRPAGSNRIGVVMAGRESRRSLPPPVLAGCLQAIFQARGGPEFVCIGTREERPLVRRLLRELPTRTAARVVDRTGATGLTDLPELMRGLDLLLTPDTGSMHLAAHLGIPVQAFFLSSAWCWETGPYGFGHKIWQALEPCSPCLESASCSRSLACLSPFGHPAFLAHLSGKFSPDWPEGLLGCTSMLDDMGVRYTTVDGGDPYSEARQELRNGLAAYKGAGRPGDALPFIRQELAEFLFTEKHWMLPQPLA